MCFCEAFAPASCVFRLLRTPQGSNFVLLGAAVPWAGWQELGRSGVALAAAVLLLRRPMTMLLLRPLLPGVHSMADALLMGWFGPVAVAAMYYAAMMEHKLSEPLIWHVVSLIACASVVMHGITGAPLIRLYGRTAPKRDQ